ncbi:MAG: restriction endonuclease subunit S, partial [Chlamydiia bacterium]|nr:restriction endonuclease subunit S [Chlamydiia bacterium]
MSSEWNSVEISSICSLIKRGISPKYSENVGLLVINQKCIRDQRLNLEKSRRNDLSAKQVSDEKYIRMGDVLINSTGVGTLGRVAQVKAILEPTTVDSHVTIVRPDPSLVDINYFGWAIRSKESFIESLGEGSTGQTEL